MTTLFNKLTPEFKSNVATKLPTIIIASLTLVAGLAWNDGFQAIIDQYVPEKYQKSHNAWFKILYAFLLTLIIVIVITIILMVSPNVNTTNIII